MLMRHSVRSGWQLRWLAVMAIVLGVAGGALAVPGTTASPP